MNQILVTKKIYVTPELKRKKKFYKVHFILSICLIAVLGTSYLYAAYDRNKSEAVSKEVLTSLQNSDDTMVNNDVLVAYLDGEPENTEHENQEQDSGVSSQSQAQDAGQNQVQRQGRSQNQVITASDGETYYAVATLSIPCINLNYPVLAETSDELLKVSLCKFWGPNPNEVGNFCIVGHNYRNKKFFSKVPLLDPGDTIDLTDVSGRTVTYSVYDKYTVDPTDVKCTSQLTSGKKEVTLITCTDDSTQRVVVKATKI